VLQALLHGKLDGELKRDAYEIEDLLTAVVIGTCSYLEPSVALVPFLAGARDVDGNLLDLTNVESVEYEFWESLAAVPRRDTSNGIEDDAAVGGEPEVILSVTRRDGSKAMLVIEAKLFSGKSSRPSPTGPVTDQLGKYWLQLTHVASQISASALGVLYLTRGLTMPRDDFAETQRELREKGHPQAKLFWLSWRTFVDAVRGSTQHRLLRDVVELLENRWYMVAVQMQPWPQVPTLPTTPRFTANWQWPPPPRLVPWGFEGRGGRR